MNKTNTSDRTAYATGASHIDAVVLEAKVGARLASALSMQAEKLPADIGERLRFARMRALEQALAARKRSAAGTSVVGRSSGGAAILGGFVPFWQRAAGVLPLVMLVAGLVIIDQWSTREQVIAVADLDAQLLADRLPPAAYSDPGFGAFLRSAPLP